MNRSRTPIIWMPMIALIIAPGGFADLILSPHAPVAIPDNNALGIQQSIEVSGFVDPIASISVTLSISGTGGSMFNGDLFVSLQHESGYAVLLNRVGRTGSDPFGYGDNGFDITLTTLGHDIHTYQSTAYTLGGSGELTGSWAPDGRTVDPDSVVATDARTATLESFNGLDPNGTWVLFVADLSQNGQAQLDAWGLDITVVPEPGTLSLVLLATGLLLRSRRR